MEKKKSLMKSRLKLLRHGLGWIFCITLLFGTHAIFFTTNTYANDSQKTPQDTLRVIAHIATSWVVGNSVVEPLVYVDNENNFVPNLAKQWTLGPEYIDLHLHQGVVFHDDTPFNSSSVLQNWERYVETAATKTPYFTLDLRLAIRDMEALDAHTVRMYFHEDAFMGQILVYLRSFYMYSPTFFEAFNGRYPQGNQANILKAGPWGTGPYEITKIQDGGAISLLHANPHYWQKGYPRTQNLEIYSPAALNTQEAYQWMIEGKADLFDAVSPSMLPILGKHAHLHRTLKYPTSHLTTLFNTRKPNSPLRDIRVREALNLLVDRHTLHRFVSQGSARMTAFILPLDESNGLQPYPYDPQRAALLLNEAGFNEANPLPLVIGYYISEEKLAKAIGAMLQSKGVAVEFEQYTTRQEYYKHIKNYTHGPDNPIEGERWDLSIVQSGLYTNTVATHFEAFYGKGGNRWIEVDDEADRLFLEAMHAPSWEKAQEKFIQMELYLYQQHYSMPLFIWPSIFTMHQRIAHNSFSGSGYLLNLKEISIAK